MSNYRVKGNSTGAILTEMATTEGVPFPANIQLPADEEGRDLVLSHFWSIIRVRSKKDWDARPFDVNLAGQLAVAMYAAQKAMEDIIATGHTIENPRGTPIMNPSVTAWSNISGRVQSLLSKMHLTLDDSHARGANAAGKAATGVRAEIEGVKGGFLAKPQ